MKPLKTIAFIGMALVFFTFGWALAGEHPGGDGKTMDHSSHGHDMDKMEHPGDLPGGNDNAMEHPSQGHDMGKMNPAGHMGNNIRNTTVDGYRLAYELIDMREKIKAMKAAGHTHEMNMTHHLMVYVKDSEGETVSSATVGYRVKTPDGQEQKTMCMGMGGGYGADINLAEPGMYTIISKMLVGEKKIMDKFSHMIH